MANEEQERCTMLRSFIIFYKFGLNHSDHRLFCFRLRFSWTEPLIDHLTWQFHYYSFMFYINCKKNYHTVTKDIVNYRVLTISNAFNPLSSFQGCVTSTDSLDCSISFVLVYPLQKSLKTTYKPL